MDAVYQLVADYLDRCRRAREQGARQIDDEQDCVCVAIFATTDDQDNESDLDDQRKGKVP